MTLSLHSTSVPAAGREPATAQPDAHGPDAASLGGAELGPVPSAPRPGWPVQAIPAPLLGTPAASVHETWLPVEPGAAIESGASDGIVWRRAGDVLYGVLALDESAFAATSDASPLQSASSAAYDRIFRLLDAQGLPHLWRVWNYMADINGIAGELERYRQFNVGRQAAFRAHHRATTGNVPAACAIGLAAGPLSIAFLAGGVAPVPVENPRQISAYHYPADYGPRTPTFSRAALVHPPGQEILFVSGTASIVGHQTLHPDDVAAQCREAMANIGAVLDEANRSARSAPFTLDALRYRIYVRHAADYATVSDTLAPLIGAAEALYVQADICRADLLVEIEAMASHPLEPNR